MERPMGDRAGSRREVRASQNVSRMCFVCGVENGAGLGARFFELADGELAGVFLPRREHQGYPGRLHGGIASTILDETIGRAINLTDPDTWGVTLELRVKFRKPVPTAEEVRAVGRITSDSTRMFEGSGEIILGDGTVAVEASGRYMKLPIDRIADGDFDRTQWFPDDRELPADLEL